jgi:hypothetical protein
MTFYLSFSQVEQLVCFIFLDMLEQLPSLFMAYAHMFVKAVLSTALV